MKDGQKEIKEIFCREIIFQSGQTRSGADAGLGSLSFWFSAVSLPLGKIRRPGLKGKRGSLNKGVLSYHPHFLRKRKTTKSKKS
jgi:hypothetical protein